MGGRTLERFGMLATSGPRNQSSRGPDQFVLEDLLIALGWIQKRHVADSLLAKYTSTGELPPTLLEAVQRRWRIPSRDYKLTEKQFLALCHLAITEHFDPKICPRCRGTGERMRWHKGQLKPLNCPECSGKGRQPFSLRAKSRALNIDKATWGNRKLEQLYERMQKSLHAWETHGRRRIDAYLKRERG